MRQWRGFLVSSEFGYRDNPMTPIIDQEFHKGIDLVKEHKAPITPFVGGLVLYAGMGETWTGLGGYGNVVALQVGSQCHLYAHLDSVAVKRGDMVTSFIVIGYQGKTGNVSGSHLHFEIRKRVQPSYGWSPMTEGYIRPDTYIDDLINNAPKKDSVIGHTIHLPKTANTWRLYPVDKAPRVGNEKALLKPAKFGGLDYIIIGNPSPDVYTIRTDNFGIGNVYGHPSTGAVIK